MEKTKENYSNFLRVRGRAKECIFFEGLERKSPQIFMEKTVVLISVCWAIIVVHGVHKHSDISSKNQRHKPWEPWLRGWRVKMGWRRWWWPSLVRARLKVTRRCRPEIPHCGNDKGKGRLHRRCKFATVTDSIVYTRKKRKKKKGYSWRGTGLAGLAVYLSLVLFPGNRSGNFCINNQILTIFLNFYEAYEPCFSVSIFTYIDYEYMYKL